MAFGFELGAENRLHCADLSLVFFVALNDVFLIRRLGAISPISLEGHGVFLPDLRLLFVARRCLVRPRRLPLRPRLRRLPTCTTEYGVVGKVAQRAQEEFPCLQRHANDEEGEDDAHASLLHRHAGDAAGHTCLCY